MIGVASFEEASLLGWGEFRTSATTRTANFVARRPAAAME